MLTLSRMPTRLLAGLLILPLAGCATQTPPPSNQAIASLLKPVPNYEKAPCWMQREWAQDNSRKASVETNGVVSYKAPCDVDPAPKAAPAAAGPKTSGVEVDAEIARRVASAE